MKSITRATLAAGISAVLALGFTPSAAQASGDAIHAQMTPPEAKQAYEEAKRQFEEQAKAYRQEASTRSKAKISIADSTTKDAADVRKKAEAAYKKSKTITNFERMVRAQSSHNQAVLSATQIKAVAPLQYKIEDRAISLTFFEVALWPYAIMMATAGNDAPETCEDALVTDTFATSSRAVDTFRATAEQSAVAYDVVLTKYKNLAAGLYDTESAAYIAYEQAVRAHKAAPSVVTKSQMAQAKLVWDEAKSARSWGVKDMKWAFTNETKTHHTTTMDEFKAELQQARADSDADFVKFDACVCTIWNCKQ